LVMMFMGKSALNKLDIGCGGSEEFSQHTVRGDVNCDILKPTVKIPNFILCDAHHLPFRDEVFQKVYMYDLIEHLDSPLQALKEARRVLKAGGELELGTPNALYLPKILRSMIRAHYTPHKDHIQTWGLPELKSLLLRAGFNASIQYCTYLNGKKPWYYSLAVKICPFSALKHRQLYATARKRGIGICFNRTKARALER